MIPRKTKRGEAALERLKVFEGIPPPYDKQKRMVVPQALRVLRLKPGRKYCTVGRLSSEVSTTFHPFFRNITVSLPTCTDFRMVGNMSRRLRNLRNAGKRNLLRFMPRRRLRWNVLQRLRRRRKFLRNSPNMGSRVVYWVVCRWKVHVDG